MALFNFDAFFSQIFWLAIFFIAQYYLLAKLVIPKFRVIFDKRIKHIEDEISMADNLTNKANEMKNAYEAKVKVAQDESMSRMNLAVIEAKKISVTQLADLENALAKDMLKQELRLQKFCSAMRGELEDISLATAAMMIEKITHDKIGQKDLEKYLLQ
jgi:F-type H+-transporting ATPase subunit b